MLIGLEVLRGDRPLPQADQEAYLHLWRYIGFLLGVRDEYNPCARDVPYAKAFLESVIVHLLQPDDLSRTVAHRESPFALDFVDVDVCFHITPLVSSLGFQGAPVRIARVQCFARSPPGTAALNVAVTEAAAGIDFAISAAPGEGANPRAHELSATEKSLSLALTAALAASILDPEL